MADILLTRPGSSEVSPRVSTRNLAARRRSLLLITIAALPVGLISVMLPPTVLAHTMLKSRSSASNSASSLKKRARWTILDGRRVEVASPAGSPVAHASAVPWGQLRNAGDGLCMSSYPDQSGAQATQWNCNGSANQHWVFIHDGPGWGLANQGMVNGSQTWCLDDYQGRQSDGNPEIMWPCYASWSWAIDTTQGGSAVGNDVLLHTDGGQGHYCVTSFPGTSSGSGLSEWLCNIHSANQAFTSVGSDG